MSTPKLPGSTRITHGQDGNTQLLLDIVRTLMQEPRTMVQITEMVDAHLNTVRQFLAIAAECGLVHRTGMGIKGRPFVFHWCPQPFEVPATAKDQAA